MAIHFPLVKANDVATIRLILQVDDFRSYDSLISIYKYKEIFKDNLNLSIHYKVFKNLPIMLDKENCVEKEKIFCVLNTTTRKNMGLLQETVK